MRRIVATAMMLVTIGLMASETVSFAKIEPSATTKNEELCKLFKTKTADYKAHMRDDDYAKATLASYEKRVSLYCEK